MRVYEPSNGLHVCMQHMRLVLQFLLHTILIPFFESLRCVTLLLESRCWLSLYFHSITFIAFLINFCFGSSFPSYSRNVLASLPPILFHCSTLAPPIHRVHQMHVTFLVNHMKYSIITFSSEMLPCFSFPFSSKTH